jgi:hypothetical protein
MSVTPLNELQRERLRDLSKVRKDRNYSTAPNIELEKYINELWSQYPEYFHGTKNSLSKRVFMDEPAAADCARFVRSWKDSPYRIIPV